MEIAEVVQKTKWLLDLQHSQIGFSVKYLMFSSVKGSFKEFDASIYAAGNDFTTADIDIWINPASIDTGISQRDVHLRNADFFDVEEFKEINFSDATIVAGEEDGHYVLHGALTMKGIRKLIKLALEFRGVVKDPWGSEKAIFNINGIISRKMWGLNWNMVLDAGGILVSDDVWINCEIQLIKQNIAFQSQ